MNDLQTALDFIEKAQELWAYIRVPQANLDVEVLSDGRYSVVPRLLIGVRRRGEGVTINAAVQDWHDKMYFDIYGQEFTKHHVG